MTKDEAREISRALRAWYRTSHRPLPWRETRDPYAIWVSEVMLQQTTAAVAGTRWRRFLARFPDVAALAAADERAVLAEWSGLGYYARARNLHRAARALAADGSTLPSDVAALSRLPGIGPYTAAAVASIAFDVSAAAVDGNVARVLARLFALRVRVEGPARRVSEIAARLVPARGAGEHNQALMELGATVCLPVRPRCAACPVRRFCRASRGGRPERIPLPARREAAKRIRLAAGIALRRGRVVVVEDLELVRGHTTVPLARVAPVEDAAAALARLWPSAAGRSVAGLEPIGGVRHSVLDRRYEVEVFRVREGAARAPAAERVMTLTQLADSPRGGLLPKVLALANLRIAP